MNRNFRLLILLALLVLGLFVGTVAQAANPPEPTYGTATVDGLTGDWDLTNDFFAPMYRAGRAGSSRHPIESNLYVRYDCATETLYVLVLSVNGTNVLLQPDDAFVKLGNSTKLVDGNYPASVFRWVGANGNNAQGFEASMPLAPGDYSNLNVHVQVYSDGEAQTSAVADRAIRLLIECDEEPPPPDCEEETAWADGPRYTQQGNWATYTPYNGVENTVTLYAGQTHVAGNVHFSAPSGGQVTITITLAPGWHFQNVAENVKIQDYASAPAGNPNPGGFDHKATAASSPFSIQVPQNNFYGVHVDVEDCQDGESATIIIHKAILDGDDSQTFDFTGDLNNFSIVGEGSSIPYVVPPGTYNVSETLPANWQLMGRSCFVNDVFTNFPLTATGIDITVEDGDEVECTFTNAERRGSITVIKIAEAAEEDEEFDFTGLGGFSLGHNEPFQTNVVLGGFNIVETVPDGWVLDSVVCMAGEFPAALGETQPENGVNVTVGTVPVVCTFTNVPEFEPNPAISIEKTADPDTIEAGDTAYFTIRVQNTGNVTLYDVEVSDPNAPDCNADIGTLAPGEISEYQCSLDNVTEGFTNVATVTGDPEEGDPVQDEDDADVHVQNPGLSISKSPDDQMILTGTTATFTILVTNTGDVPLSGVMVTDTLAPDCDRYIGDLGVGEDYEYQCTLENVTEDFTNVAEVTGYSPLETLLSDEDDADVDVINPSILITKSPDQQTILSGGTATFQIYVLNDGDVDLTGVVISDPLVPDCDHNIGDLAVGAEVNLECSISGVLNDFTNVIYVTGYSPLQTEVTDDDDADVEVINPGILITKTPDDQTIVSGGTATFTIYVENTGDADLTNVTVSDPNAPDCDAFIGNLAAGASTSYDCTLENVTEGFINTANVTGTTPIGGQVNDNDSANVDVINPSIRIRKNPDSQTIFVGGTASFEIRVENTGDVTLTPVVVWDPLAPDCDRTFTSMAPGAVETYNCTLSNVQANFTNTAYATGTPPVGPTVGASDNADVIVEEEPVEPECTSDPSGLTGYIVVTGFTAQGFITNNGNLPYCGLVGLASYKKYNDVIDDQDLFDAENPDVRIDPGQTFSDLHVDLPGCAVQVDLFWGPLLPNLAGQRYGIRLLQALNIHNTYGFCQRGDQNPIP